MNDGSTRGKLFIFTAPSGAGKTTIVRHLLKTFPFLSFSVSATTRAKRSHEEDGKDYYFLDADAFREKIRQGAFLEWEEVYEDHFYGTLRSEVDRLLGEGKHVVFDIDVQGALNIKKIYGADALAIFVKPPSREILLHRLRQRKTETAESLHRRIDKAEKELQYEKKFDYVLVNNDLGKALKEAEELVLAFIRTPNP